MRCQEIALATSTNSHVQRRHQHHGPHGSSPARIVPVTIQRQGSLRFWKFYCNGDGSPTTTAINCKRTYNFNSQAPVGAGATRTSPPSTASTTTSRARASSPPCAVTAERGESTPARRRRNPDPTNRYRHDVPAGRESLYRDSLTCVALYSAVAARVGKHRVSYEPNISGVPDPSGLQLRVDGVLTTLGPQGIDLDGIPDRAAGS